MPVISQGKLFLFDRHGDKARLTCMKAETGEVLWKFEYPTDYEDQFGYNNGPRCCPVVDGDRVYIYGAEGMLHCVARRRRQARLEGRHAARSSASCRTSSASAARRSSRATC